MTGEEPMKETEEETERVETQTAAERICRQLEYVYPYRSAEELPSKITATELKGREEADQEAAGLSALSSGKQQKTISAFRMPDFAGKKELLKGAALGTAMHTVLQYIDFQKTETVEEISGEIRRLEEQKYITEKEAESIKPEKILKLFQSETGKRMKTAEHCRREFRFSLLCRAGDLMHDGGDDEVLLQGIMDCIIEEQGALTIIDYKTDSIVTEGMLQERTEYYTGQLATYAMAAERIFGLPVKQCILYFLFTGDGVEVSPARPVGTAGTAGKNEG